MTLQQLLTSNNLITLLFKYIEQLFVQSHRWQHIHSGALLPINEIGGMFALKSDFWDEFFLANRALDHVYLFVLLQP